MSKHGAARPQKPPRSDFTDWGRGMGREEYIPVATLLPPESVTPALTDGQ